MADMMILSPGFISVVNDDATRLMLSVVPRVKMISLSDEALMN
ncbi:hypothetical protein SDC9_134918 [bioreactor metagenome]|uniref:Uncharacterized protein n=1 Tax=bioreactor metagenome TaxID=1076179 RepID=A0A645DFL4_9ZZZZ